MMKIFSIAWVLGAFVVLVAADTERSKQAPLQSNVNKPVEAVTTPQKPLVNDGVAADAVPASSAAAPVAFSLDWYSINGGGAINAASGSYQMGLSVGQAAAGFASGGTYQMGIGFWYGAAADACPVTMTGDVNNTAVINSADIIYLVNYVFKGGALPIPCAAAGDVNCTGTVNSADIIYLVNYVFKGGIPPCDVCAIVPSLWSCP